MVNGESVHEEEVDWKASSFSFFVQSHIQVESTRKKICASSNFNHFFLFGIVNAI